MFVIDPFEVFNSYFDDVAYSQNKSNFFRWVDSIPEARKKSLDEMKEWWNKTDIKNTTLNKLLENNVKVEDYIIAREELKKEGDGKVREEDVTYYLLNKNKNNKKKLLRIFKLRKMGLDEEKIKVLLDLQLTEEDLKLLADYRKTTSPKKELEEKKETKKQKASI